MTDDSFALCRNKDPLSLAEAAAMLCHAKPGLTYNRRNTAERHAQDSILTMQRELIKEIRDQRLSGEIKMRHWTTGGDYNEFTRKPNPVKHHGEIDLEAPTIPRAALIEWATNRGLDLSAFNVPQSDTTVPTGDDALETKIRVLRKAWRKFWKDVDRDDKTSWHDQGEVRDWIKDNANVSSDRLASALASYIAPDWAKGGGRRPK